MVSVPYKWPRLLHQREKLDLQAKALEEIARLYDNGLFKSIVTRRFDLTVDGLRKAHEGEKAPLIFLHESTKTFE